MNNYRAEYQDNEIVIISQSSHEEAIQEAFLNEDEHGTLFNVTLLDENYDEVETIY